MEKKIMVWMLALSFCLGITSWAAPGQFSIEGNRCSLIGENMTLVQILDLFKQQLGLKYELPPELRNQVVPMVSLVNLSSRDAFVKLLEGIQYDYILLASPSDPGRIAQLTITEKSSQSAPVVASNPNVAAAPARRFNRQVIEDPFSGGGEEDETANMGNEPVPANTPPMGIQPAGQGMMPQGAQSIPPGGQSMMGQPNPQGMYNMPQGIQFQNSPGLNMQTGFPGAQGSPPQQNQPNSTIVQPFPGNYNNPNIRRTPF
jgi:hypothetical protein